MTICALRFDEQFGRCTLTVSMLRVPTVLHSDVYGNCCTVYRLLRFGPLALLCEKPTASILLRVAVTSAPTAAFAPRQKKKTRIKLDNI